jgi:thiol-disulfide isomerase/thioredoxin
MMPFDPLYHDVEPTRAEIDQSTGYVLVEFGADWCGHCQAISPVVQTLLQQFGQVEHVRIADGRGKRLGRSFAVKFWPTLVLLRDGVIVAQWVRPSANELKLGMSESLSDRL